MMNPCFLFAFLVFVVLLPCIAQDAPVLQVTPEAVHLGTIPDDREVTITFTIANRGETVQVQRIETSCGCTSASALEEIPARGEAKLTLVLDPKGRKGYMRWQTRLYTDLAEQPVVSLLFDATILQNSFLSDTYINFGEFARGTDLEKKVWISQRRFAPFKILGVRQVSDRGEHFSIRVNSESYDGFYPGEGEAYCLTIAPKTDIPYGRIESKIEITTDLDKFSKVVIPMVARVAGEIGLRPDAAFFGIVRDKGTVWRHLYLYHRNRQSFALGEIRSDLDFLSFAVQPIVPKQYYKIKVNCNIHEKVPPGEFRGTIYIQTSSKEQPQIEVPVQGFFANPKEVGVQTERE